MKDIRNFLLALLSAGLIGTWVYHLYDKTQYSNRKTEVYVKDSVAVAEGVRDSLERLYTATIVNLDSKLDSTRSNADSLKFQLNTKLTEIYKLKNEIDAILKNRGASKKDLSIAEQKIKELQILVDELRTQKETMEGEQQRLTNVMTQLSGEISTLQQTMKKLDEENKVLTEKVNLAATFVATDVQLTPVAVKNDKEQESNQAKKVTKLVISFAVQNNLNQYNNADVFIVITQPDGNILKNEDVWEPSATMTLHNGGKIPYTRKVRFEYIRGESKKILLSINAEEYTTGAYTLQIYHNGNMIGQVTKTLV